MCCVETSVHLAALLSAFSERKQRIHDWPQLFLKSFVWAHYQSQLTVSYRRTVYLLLELLFVKCGSLSVSCLSQADITYAIDSICMS